MEKWPRTQTIGPLWEVNSGAFIASKAIYVNNMDRIGDTPYLFQLSDKIAFDIDWLPDFRLAETLHHNIRSGSGDAICAQEAPMQLPNVWDGTSGNPPKGSVNKKGKPYPVLEN